MGDPLVGAGEIGIAEHGADVAGRAVGIEEQARPWPADRRRSRRWPGSDRRTSGRSRTRRSRPGSPAAAPRPATSCRSARAPRTSPSTVPGTPAESPLYRASLNGSGSAVLEERLGAHRRRRRLAVIDRRHAAVGGPVDHHEPAAADAGRERLGHPQHGRRRHRRIDGVAALAATCRSPPRVANFSTVAAAPPVPTAVGGPDGATAWAADPTAETERHRTPPREHQQTEPTNGHVAPLVATPTRESTLDQRHRHQDQTPTDNVGRRPRRHDSPPAWRRPPRERPRGQSAPLSHGAEMPICAATSAADVGVRARRSVRSSNGRG